MALKKYDRVIFENTVNKDVYTYDKIFRDYEDSLDELDISSNEVDDLLDEKRDELIEELSEKYAIIYDSDDIDYHAKNIYDEFLDIFGEHVNPLSKDEIYNTIDRYVYEIDSLNISIYDYSKTDSYFKKYKARIKKELNKKNIEYKNKVKLLKSKYKEYSKQYGDMMSWEEAKTTNSLYITIGNYDEFIFRVSDHYPRTDSIREIKTKYDDNLFCFIGLNKDELSELNMFKRQHNINVELDFNEALKYFGNKIIEISKQY